MALLSAKISRKGSDVEVASFARDKKIMVTVQEFCQISGMSDRQVRQLTHIEGFPMIRSGWKILIHRERAIAWLADFAGRPEAMGVR